MVLAFAESSQRLSFPHQLCPVSRENGNTHACQCWRYYLLPPRRSCPASYARTGGARSGMPRRRRVSRRAGRALGRGRRGAEGRDAADAIPPQGIAKATLPDLAAATHTACSRLPDDRRTRRQIHRRLRSVRRRPREVSLSTAYRCVDDRGQLNVTAA